MESGKGKSRDFRLSQALAPYGPKGFFRRSRKWMNLMTERIGFEVVSPVYLLTTMKPIAEELFIVCTGGG
jgi:hypothetical protein